MDVTHFNIIIGTVVLKKLLNSCSDSVITVPFRLEQAKEDESKDALKDLVNLVTALTTYGVSDLKTACLTTGAPFLLPGFVVPQPSGKGQSSMK